MKYCIYIKDIKVMPYYRDMSLLDVFVGSLHDAFMDVLYDKILYVITSTIIPTDIVGPMFKLDVDIVYGNYDIILLTPNKLVAKMLNTSTLESIYKDYAVYESIPPIFKPYELYQNSNINNNILNKIILNEKLDYELYKNNRSIFERCFIHKSYNNVYNYELLEAYGDKLLAGIFADLTSNIPGIITPDQYTHIANYFQDKSYLNSIFIKLGFTDKHIYTDDNIKIDVKIKSDVIEALIGAIYIVYGYELTKNFIYNIYDKFKFLDPSNIDKYIMNKDKVDKLINMMDRDKFTVSKDKRSFIYDKDTILAYVDNPKHLYTEILQNGKLLMLIKSKYEWYI